MSSTKASSATVVLVTLHLLIGTGETKSVPECQEGDEVASVRCMGEADQAFSSQVQERWYDLSADGRLSLVCVNLHANLRCLDLLEGCETEEEIQDRKTALLEDTFGVFYRAQAYLNMGREEFFDGCPVAGLYANSAP